MRQSRLKDKISIVTGGSTGIGKAIAFALAECGSKVVLASRNEQALNENARVINDRGGKAWAIPVDITQQDQVNVVINQVLEEWGRIDVLISNAGKYIRKPIVDLDVDLLEQSMRINYFTHIYLVLAVLPHMLERGDGNIVFMATMNAKKGHSPDAPYVSAKFALSGFAEVLRQEMRPKGIAVTTIYPGRVDTPMVENLNFPWISAKIPPEAVARAVIKAIEKRKAEVILPFQASLLHYINVFSPRLGDWFSRTIPLEGWEKK
jgi:uncharacterized protein